MSTLLDGTVVPSYFQLQTRGAGRGKGDDLNDTVLRLGEIKALVYPDDELSYYKAGVEYVVDVQYRSGGGDTVVSSYRGATTLNAFGGVADYFQATLRPDTGEKRETTMGVGSKVVVLCLGGNSKRALILGGVVTGDKQASSDDGHNLFFEFNGVRFTVDKEGQPTLLFRGATKADGNLADSADAEAEGTKVTISKDGSLTVSTPDDKQILRLNHADKKIEVVADEQWHATVNGELQFEVTDDIKLSSSDAGMQVETAKDVTIKSTGVKVGDATDAWMMGTTYRNQEQMLHKKMGIALQALSTMLQTVGSMLQVGSTALMTPIYGGVLAKPALTAASVLLQQPIPQAISQIKSALDSFEGNASQYLSKKNKND